MPYNIYVDVENENENEKIKNDEITLLIKKDSKIPISSKEVSFRATKNNQKLYKIKIYYGEGKYIKDNMLIAEFVIDNLPSKKAGKLKLLLSIEIKYEKYNLYVFIDIKSIHIKKIEVFSIEVKKIKKKPNELNKQKLLFISEEIDFLKDTNIFIKNNEKDIDKMEYLKKLSNSCSKIIDIYEQFKEDDNIKNIIKNIYENIFEYSKLYIFIIILK